MKQNFCMNLLFKTKVDSQQFLPFGQFAGTGIPYGGTQADSVTQKRAVIVPIPRF